MCLIERPVQIGAFAAALLCLVSTASAQIARGLRPGDILVNQDYLVPGGAAEHGTFLIDPVTLQKTPFYQSYEAPNSLAVDRDGTVLSADGFFREIVRLDSQGRVLRRYKDVRATGDMAIAPDGGIYLSRFQRIYRLDPASGVVAQVANIPQAEGQVNGLASGPDGSLYVTRTGGLPTSPRGVFRVDLTNGTLTPVSTGGLLTGPFSLTFDGTGSLIVSDLSSSLVRVDPATGAQQLLSSGGLLERPGPLALEPRGTLLVIGSAPGGAGSGLLRVDPATGAQTFLTGLTSPIDLAVVPFPEPWGGAILIASGVALLRRRR